MKILIALMFITFSFNVAHAAEDKAVGENSTVTCEEIFAQQDKKAPISEDTATNPPQGKDAVEVSR